MEDIPPSYYQSTNPSVLDLIAQYLDTPSLHSLTLVSRHYNETFMPHLWGSPASHFVPMSGPASPGAPRTSKTATSYDDIVYIALTRFKRILRIARESTRQLVHTLYLPAAASEIYSGPNATWLRDILDGLPNLQSLCVSGLPFFDHHSLVAVDKSRSPHPYQGHRAYSVKLLLASKEPNTTSIGLSLFLPHLRNLVYLDLSHTIPARDMNVLSSFSHLYDLQVLKLRGIGLRDPEGEVLANAIGLRVRLLDVTDNLLGDMAVRSLLQGCFMHPTDQAGMAGQANTQVARSGTRFDHFSRRHLESWPVGLPPAPDFLSLDTLRSSDFDKNLLSQLTHPLTGRLAFEDIPHGGITHLYLTGNPAITFEGVRGLLELGRLHVLDAGEIAGETAVDKYVKSVRNSGRRQSHAKSVSSGNTSLQRSHLSGGHDGQDSEESTTLEDMIQLPGAEKLIPTLRDKASGYLTYLRIEHSVITKEADPGRDIDSKLESKVELPASQPAVELNAFVGDAQLVEAPGSGYHAVEMSSHPDIFELDATPIMRAELIGDLIHFALSPPIGDKPDIEAESNKKESATPIRGEGAYAPEVLQEDLNKEGPDKIVLDATGSGKRRQPDSTLSPKSRTSGRAADVDAEINPTSATRKESSSLPSAPSSADCQAQLERLVNLRPGATSPRLHPSSLPNLRTLVLTNVPDKVLGTSSAELKSIKAFITACAAESFIAVLKAQTNYSLPPGRARAAAERKHARSLFALRTIVLEVSPIEDNRQRDWKHTRQRLNISKSSTGDHDSEALWSAAENDFSFFGEAGEEQDECGIYDHEPGKYFPSVHLDDKFAVTSDDLSRTPPGSSMGFAGNFNINSPTGTMFRSPRELPLGRNRRSSNETRLSESTSVPNRSSFHEMMGTMPMPQSRLPQQQPGPTSAPQNSETPQMVDLVAELSKWRKERKTAHEEELRRRRRVNGVTVASRIAESEVHVEGYWPGEIKVVRKPKSLGNNLNRGQGRLERNGMVDVYGNYFEKGYLYS